MTNHKILEIEVQKLKDQLLDKETIIQLLKRDKEKEAEREEKKENNHKLLYHSF